jgi:hypothetical protein
LLLRLKKVPANVNVVDVNVTITSKEIEEHVFKDRNPRKANSVINMDK